MLYERTRNSTDASTPDVFFGYKTKVDQLVKKLSSFYEIWRFIIMLARSRYETPTVPKSTPAYPDSQRVPQLLFSFNLCLGIRN